MIYTNPVQAVDTMFLKSLVYMTFFWLVCRPIDTFLVSAEKAEHLVDSAEIIRPEKQTHGLHQMHSYIVNALWNAYHECKGEHCLDLSDQINVSDTSNSQLPSYS